MYLYIMKLLITGATGLIGKAIVNQCHSKGFEIHYLTTSRSKIVSTETYKGFYWNPKNNEIDVACFEGVSAIINLAGATISKRWTSSYKNEILNSRINSLHCLYGALKDNDHHINHMISASGVGIYPDSKTTLYSENEVKKSTSFLGQVVEKWETEADKLSQLNLKISKLRIGLVLASNGGAFPKIINPIRYGFGAAFGKGDQWQSWIHIEDLAKLFIYMLERNLEGNFNAVAPHPVTNLEFTRICAKHLKRPLLLPNIPKSIMSLVLGEMHQLLFESQKVSANKVEELGFEFEHSDLESALKDLIHSS